MNIPYFACLNHASRACFASGESAADDAPLAWAPGAGVCWASPIALTVSTNIMSTTDERMFLSFMAQHLIIAPKIVKIGFYLVKYKFDLSKAASHSTKKFK